MTAPSTLQEAAERFVASIQVEHTANTYRWALVALARSMVGNDNPAQPPLPLPLDQLQPGVLADFYVWLGQHYARATAPTYLAAARRLLQWLDANDWLPDTCPLGKALSRLRVARGERHGAYKSRQVDPDLPEIVLYYDNLTLPIGDDWKSRRERLVLLRDRALIHTLYASGGRVSEVVALTREMVLGGRLAEAHLIGKGGYPRVILFTPEAQAAIRAYLRERTDSAPALFVSHGRDGGTALSRHSVWRIVKRAALICDLADSTSPHSFRHYRATQLLNEGMPLESVQAYLGHQDIATTRKVYAHTHTAVLRDQLATFGLSPDEALRNK